MKPALALITILTLCACREEETPAADIGVHDATPTDVAVRDGLPDSVRHDAPTAPDDLPPVGDNGPPADLPPAVDQGPVTVGPIVITEFLADPEEVADTAGEWIELYNPGTQPVDIKGWTLKDDASNSHVIATSLVIGPKSYSVLGRSTTTSTNGGVQVDYKYTSFTLTNTDDEIVLLDATGAEVDRVAYGTKWFLFSGYSTALKSPTLDNTKLQNWCFSAGAWSGSAGDYGSPGGSSNCAPLVPTGCTHTTVKTLQFSSHLCPRLLAAWKKITIRNGLDTSPVVGDWARFYCIGYGFELEAQITTARHTTYGGITQQEYMDDGFATQADMLAALQGYYPGITLSSPATIFRWASPTLCNWP